MSKISNHQDILKSLLDKLLLPRIVDLEQKEKALEADIIMCNSKLIDTIKIINTPPRVSLPPDQCRSKSKSHVESSRSIKERVSRPPTPSSKGNRETITRDSFKGRNLTNTVKKNLDNSLSIFSQKTSQTTLKTHKSIEIKRDKSQANIKTPDKTKPTNSPNAKNMTRKHTPTKFIVQEKIPREKSSKNFIINKLNIKKLNQKTLNNSKTSIPESNKNNLSLLNTSGTKASQSKQTTAKNIKNNNPITYITTENDNLKFVKSDLDVSNLITLEQDVNDELIINQKEDKLLNTSLNEYDEGKLSPLKLSERNSNKKIISLKSIDDMLDEKWSILSSFMTKYDLLFLMTINKKFYKLCITKILANNKAEMTKYNEKIKYLYEKYSEKELSSPFPEFSLSKGSIKAIDLLNTPLYSKLFNKSSVPHENILFPYKLYFRLIGKPDICKLNNIEFWSDCCSFFIKDNEKTGDIINNSLKTLDLSEDNIFKISRMLQNKEKLITPNFYSKTCATSGLIIFILKDIFEYIGLISDKRTLACQLLKLNKTLYNKSIEVQMKLLSLEKKFQVN